MHLDKLFRHAAKILDWWPGYVRTRVQRRGSQEPARVWLMIADHFEPLWRNADDTRARERVAIWRKRWPEIAARHRDSGGRSAQYTFFYPTEQYRPYFLDSLAELTRLGIADVEVHIHHDGEGEQHFVDSILGFTGALHKQHGLLREWRGGIGFGFIHGNWALDNALANGRYCGLNNEISLLKRLGCYADFTLPAAPSPAQTSTVNTIYWATDDPERPRSHEKGIPVEPGGSEAGDLMLIPGPLGLIWTGMGRFFPYLENGELASHALPSPARVRGWLRFAPRLGEDLFLKLYAHGTQEAHAAALLGGGLDACLGMVGKACVESGLELHFVTAWEMWSAVEAIRLRKDPLNIRDLTSLAASQGVADLK